MLARLARHPFLQAVLVAIIAAAVYLPFLGVRPLDFSEGHRAVPGWTMLESGDYWHVKMFGLTYIRKPPGMAWAIAASSSLLGETPLGARMPSAICAILMSLLAWWYGKKWFGVARAYWPVTEPVPREEHGPVGPCHGSLAGVAAGLAQALMPLMWSPGRTAEIEMLNNLGTQMFALGLLDLLLGVSRRGAEGAEEGGEESPFAFLCALCASARDILLPAVGLFIAALAKGPSSAPVLGGVLIGACIAARSFRPLTRRDVWIAMIFGVAAIALIGMKVLIANDDPDAVREDVAEQFLWSAKRVLGVTTLLPLAFVSTLPTSLALLVPKGTSNARGDVGATLARTLTWAWLISLAVLILCGVSNPRYAMPAAVLLPLLVPHAIGLLRTRAERPGAPRWSLDRLLLLGSPARWALVMLLGSWWFTVLTSISPTDDQKAGVAAASLLAGFTRGGELWADDAIEARPDILWMMHQQVPRLRIRWAKAQMQRGELPPQISLILIRTDPGSMETNRYQVPSDFVGFPKLGAAQVRGFEFTLYEVHTSRLPPTR